MSLISIDVVRLQNAVNSAKQFGTDPLCSDDIKELLEANKLVSNAIQLVKDYYKAEFIKKNLVGQSIDSDEVSIKVYETGSKFEIKDETEVPPEMLEVKLCPKKVQEFWDQNSKLPNGIVEKTRTYAVKLSLKEGYGTV